MPHTSAIQPLRFATVLSAHIELTKPRLSALSVLTAIAGFFCAPDFEITPAFFWMITGASLCAGGVAALNQWMEADTDARMARTASRPIPSGRIAPGSAFVLGWAMSMAGLAILYASTNGLAAFFALATNVAYLAFYTPAKRRSRFSTEIGAVAGALPPLIGWAANEHRVVSISWILFAMLFLWQIPHFMAIAWIHRRDYETVAFPMLAVRDGTGRRVAAYSVVCTAALTVAGTLPYFVNRASLLYLGITLVLGSWFMARAVCFFLAKSRREQAAKKLFFASIAWLPLQLLALACA